MGNSKGNGPMGSDAYCPVVDKNTRAPWATSPPMSVGHPSGEKEFNEAVDIVRAEIMNGGLIGSVDGTLRQEYVRLLRTFREQIVQRVRSGELTWGQAADEAYQMRDDVMQAIRARSTPVGKAVAESIKAKSPTLNELIGKKTVELFGEEAKFAELTLEQRNRVYGAVVDSAGKSHPKITARMRTASRAGKGLMVLSVGISVYNVATAEDKVDAALHEGASTGAGILGGMGGGAIAGLACGPGAPVCVTIGVFVGGAAAALGVDFLWGD